MKDTFFTRKRTTIKDLTTGEVTKHGTVNKAKKASAALQIKHDGALGLGSVQKWRKA